MLSILSVVLISHLNFPQCRSKPFPGIPSADIRGEIRAFSPLLLPQGRVGPFSHQGTLLTHTDLTINQNSQIPSCRATFQPLVPQSIPHIQDDPPLDAEPGIDSHDISYGWNAPVDQDLSVRPLCP